MNSTTRIFIRVHGMWFKLWRVVMYGIDGCQWIVLTHCSYLQFIPHAWGFKCRYIGYMCFPSSHVTAICFVSHYNLKCIDGLVHERHNSIANTQESHLFCTNPSVYTNVITFQVIISINYCPPLSTLHEPPHLYPSQSWQLMGSSIL